jgi:hypothetical protein
MIKRGLSLFSLLTHTPAPYLPLAVSFQAQAYCLITQEAYDTISQDLLLAETQIKN